MYWELSVLKSVVTLNTPAFEQGDVKPSPDKRSLLLNRGVSFILASLLVKGAYFNNKRASSY